MFEKIDFCVSGGSDDDVCNDCSCFLHLVYLMVCWVFEEHTKETDTQGGAGWGYANAPNKCMKIYSIRAESPNGTEYYQVIVTNDTNYADQKVPVAAKPTVTPAVTNSCGNGYSQSHIFQSVCRWQSHCL